MTHVPGVFYDGLVMVPLSVWAEDSRGLFIAGICFVLGALQLLFEGPGSFR